MAQVTPTIRPYARHDLPRLLALVKDVGWAERPQDAMEIAIAASRATFIALVKNRRIGFVRLVGDGIYTLFVCDLCVHPKVQRMGVGAALLERCVEVAERSQVRRLELIATPDSKLFYERRGFVPVPGYATKTSTTFGEVLSSRQPLPHSHQHDVLPPSLPLDTHFDGNELHILTPDDGECECIPEGLLWDDPRCLDRSPSCRTSRHSDALAPEVLLGPPLAELFRARLDVPQICALRNCSQPLDGMNDYALCNEQTLNVRKAFCCEACADDWSFQHICTPPAPPAITFARRYYNPIP